ncbi:MAG: EamA family transporter [Actinobacteria bacterium]|uniref:Unannotated protein n=1 Tax=freshwater metagenome TaxID=449393 RepID=A0A6J6PM75_9ZZZZ|nr:EamA family transporter [Actinomycetota bacterium]
MTPRRFAVPAVTLVLGAALSVQGGAAIAKSLFPTLGPPGVVFLRLAFGSLTLWVIGKPQLRGRSRHDLGLVAALGLTLVCMNLTFYESLNRLPLGIAVTVEFIGPLAVAAAGSRRIVDGVWVLLAGGGIALLADGGGKAVHPTGLLLAAIAGVFWGLYIVIGKRAGQRFTGTTALAPAMALGAVVALPWGIASGGHHFTDPQLLGAGIGVSLLSAALPWSLEMEAMRRMRMTVFGVLMSLEPAIAALSGFVLLGEHLRPRAWVALAMVTVASAGVSRTVTPGMPPDA